MKFKDIIGQEFITAYLKKVWKTGRLPHAFLFSGQNGVGKTAAARTLAMLKFCCNPDSERCEPCGTCRDCTAVLEGTHPDMCQLLTDENMHSIQIGKPEDIPPQDPYRLTYPATVREVLYSLEKKSSAGKFLLLDHSEKLTVPAANALLKSIEEPSQNTLYVLTTVDAESNLPTIVSRCHVLRFRNIPVRMISEFLQKNSGVKPETADRIACISQGSLTRASDIINKNILPVREWVRNRMEHITEWDTFALSEEIREIAPGMVVGFAGDGHPGKKSSTKAPLREGLQQIFEMMLEYLRDVSVADEKPPFFYFNRIEDPEDGTGFEAVASAQEDIIHAYSAIGQNVNPLMVVDNLLFSLKSRFTDNRIML